MTKKEKRAYSRYTVEALQLLSLLIKTTRVEKKITMQDLCERAGISRDLLSRIEKADPACSIGVVFEVAALLGIDLFESDYSDLLIKNKLIKEKLTLLPQRVKNTVIEVDDNF